MKMKKKNKINNNNKFMPLLHLRLHHQHCVPKQFLHMPHKNHKTQTRR